jgi:hypothetical protein
MQPSSLDDPARFKVGSLPGGDKIPPGRRHLPCRTPSRYAKTRKQLAMLAGLRECSDDDCVKGGRTVTNSVDRRSRLRAGAQGSARLAHCEATSHLASDRSQIGGGNCRRRLGVGSRPPPARGERRSDSDRETDSVPALLRLWIQCGNQIRGAEGTRLLDTEQPLLRAQHHLNAHHRRNGVEVVVEGDAVRRPLSLTSDQLRSLPSRTLTKFIECANGRSLFAEQQDTPASGTQWRLGAVGDARWGESPWRTFSTWRVCAGRRWTCSAKGSTA